MRSTRVAAVSMNGRLGEPTRILDEIDGWCGRAAAEGAELVLFPELVVHGHCTPNTAELAEAVPDGPSVTRLARLARQHGLILSAGLSERERDLVYNTQVLVGPGGYIGKQRKLHLSRDEVLFYAGGRDLPVFDVGPCKVGIAICYDNEFPEVPRALALAGADVLALPVNWPLVPRPDGEHAPEVIQAMGSARSSRLPTVIADRIGSERGVAWTGGTTVIDGDGWIAAVSDDGVALADLTLTPGDKALSPRNDLFGDRRPDLY